MHQYIRKELLAQRIESALNWLRRKISSPCENLQDSVPSGSPHACCWPGLPAWIVLLAIPLLNGCTTSDGRTPQMDRHSDEQISAELSKSYREFEEVFRQRGYLRTDDGTSEGPLSVEQFLENFEQIAFYTEHSIVDGAFKRAKTPATLRRWEKPLRIMVLFGDSVPDEARRSDIRNVRAFAKRLESITGLEISLVTEDPNVVVTFVNYAERRRFAYSLYRMLDGISLKMAESFTNSPPDQFCSVLTLTSEGSGEIQSAVVLVKSEQPDLLRLACIHEELAQSLGLMNDSKNARPSVFNDDEEFALLTKSDEDMIRLLYDRRLQAGRDARSVLPIAREIYRQEYATTW